MKKILLILALLFYSGVKSQCNQYLIYESFSTSLPTQKGTWINTSVIYGTTASVTRTGSNYLTFDALNDAIRLPQIANPGVLTFYYRRSTTSTGTPKFSVETSPDGTTWTERLAVTTFSTTYTLASVNLGDLSLTNVHIRVIDKRASGTAARYIDDLGLTSTVSSTNTLIPFIGNCSQTLTSSLTYTITDAGGPSDKYNNNLDQTVTLTPSDNTKKLKLDFTEFNMEASYDYLYVYDGPNISSTLLGTLNGTSLPSTITAENASGQLTLRFTSDVVGLRVGFSATVTSVTVCTTPTNGGTLSSNKILTTVNDAVSLTTTGNGGTITKIEFSYNNFGTVDGTFNTPTNPFNIQLNMQQPNIYFRTTSKDGTCPSGTSNIVNITLKSAPPYSSGIVDGDHITNVTFSDINNTTTNDGDAYSDYTSIIGNVTKGEPYNLSVTASNTLSPGQGYGAWIDWNGDGIFQTSENVLLKPTANSTSQSITIPLDAVTGDVLMRILSVWNSTPNVDAYYSTGYGYGEIEEYTIRLSNPISLPVELIEFEGYPYQQYNVIKWTTASEHNSSYFDLEMSLDGVIWKTISTKEAAYNSNTEIKYSFIDYNLNELTYYRLTQYDIDGQFKIYYPISVFKQIKDKKIVKYINLLGQEVDQQTKGLLLEIYDDGTIRKIIN